MPRRKVTFRPGEYYHVYNRGVNRQPIFFSRENQLHFLRTVREWLHSGEVQRRGWRRSQSDLQLLRPVRQSTQNGHPMMERRPVQIIAWCLMPNHYHFLVRLWCVDFSDRMRSLSKSYTQAVNRERSRSGPLFEGRFQAAHVDCESYLHHLTRYIHLNPVDAGLVRTPSAWEFSSFRDYIGQRIGTLAEPIPVLDDFGSRERYREFVEARPEPPRCIAHLLIDG